MRGRDPTVPSTASAAGRESGLIAGGGEFCPDSWCPVSRLPHSAERRAAGASPGAFRPTPRTPPAGASDASGLSGGG
eukprot:12432157-Alexandrium_andersonii.AAC.1